ncbi:hypothetical protein N8368_02800 [Bacteroidia bacterium]|nr:hypothetical protein [Bacteroidia bacterium]
MTRFLRIYSKVKQQKSIPNTTTVVYKLSILLISEHHHSIRTFAINAAIAIETPHKDSVRSFKACALAYI